MTLILGDCLEEMKKLPDKSVDLLFCDLPYEATSCKWDCAIDLSQFWIEVNRICKETTPMFFTCSTKFGVSLINSNPKNFRYDMVWIKSAPCGFLNAKKMPMRKHEMLYVFYRKLPFYDLTSHTHKFLKEVPTKRGTKERGKDKEDTKGMIINRSKSKMETVTTYDPPLPTSVITTELYSQNGEARELYRNEAGQYEPPLPTTILRETTEKECYNGAITYNYEDREGAIYDPPLPNTILEIKSEKSLHPTQKPTALIEWCLKYFSKEGDTVLDPTAGSGSTGVACKKMNRKYICIEKDPDIFNTMKERLK
jgi:site-specific DNA-methyltransferase (adenine-specific)